MSRTTAKEEKMSENTAVPPEPEPTKEHSDESATTKNVETEEGNHIDHDAVDEKDEQEERNKYL